MYRNRYRIAVVGELPPEDANLRDKLSARLEEIRASLDENTHLCFLAPPEGLDSTWAAFSRDNQVDCLPIPQAQSADGTQVSEQARRRLVQISDLSDMVLGVWDEDPEGAESYIWETLHRCMEKGVPCLWISKKTGEEYWAQSSLFVPFQTELLQKHFLAMQMDPQWDAPAEKLPWGNRLIYRGNRLYQKMLDKFAMKASETPACQDSLMEEASVLNDEQAETARLWLLKSFQESDRCAIALSELYRGSIYWRSILPMLATILLAIGCYADALFKAVRSLFPGEVITPRPVFVLMSLAFFLHAVMFLSSHLLARNPVIRSWHAKFLYHRIIAEILRFYVHVIPFGITLPLRRILVSSGFDMARKQPIYVRIWHILHNPQAEQPAYREENIPAFLQYLEDYLRAQLAYHKRNANRFRKLRDRLHTLETWLVSAGIVAVILRGIAQFLIIGVNRNLVVFVSNFSLPEFSSSLANMLAMIIPAFASYYSGKLNLFGFEESITMDTLMQERLEEAIGLVHSMEGRAANYSMIRNLTEQIAILVMGDVASWNHEMTKRKIKGL